jgi:hypothetical protein
LHVWFYQASTSSTLPHRLPPEETEQQTELHAYPLAPGQ